MQDDRSGRVTERALRWGRRRAVVFFCRQRIRKDSIIGSDHRSLDEILAVNHLSLFDRDHKTAILNDISLTIRQGEILGIAGVEGNGQTQLAEVIAGLKKADEGIIRLKRKENSDSLSHETIAHIPEDRHARGLVLDFSIADVLVG